MPPETTTATGGSRVSRYRAHAAKAAAPAGSATIVASRKSRRIAARISESVTTRQPSRWRESSGSMFSRIRPMRIPSAIVLGEESPAGLPVRRASGSDAAPSACTP